MVMCDASFSVSFASPGTSDEVSVSAFATVFASLLFAADVSAICVESPAALSPEHPLSATVSVSNILAKRTFPNFCPLFVMSFTPFHMLYLIFPVWTNSMLLRPHTHKAPYQHIKYSHDTACTAFYVLLNFIRIHTKKQVIF